jgi:hypothetical protein
MQSGHQQPIEARRLQRSSKQASGPANPSNATLRLAAPEATRHEAISSVIDVHRSGRV